MTAQPVDAVLRGRRRAHRRRRGRGVRRPRVPRDDDAGHRRPCRPLPGRHLRAPPVKAALLAQISLTGTRRALLLVESSIARRAATPAERLRAVVADLHAPGTRATTGWPGSCSTSSRPSRAADRAAVVARSPAHRGPGDRRPAARDRGRRPVGGRAEPASPAPCSRSGSTSPAGSTRRAVSPPRISAALYARACPAHGRCVTVPAGASTMGACPPPAARPTPIRCRIRRASRVAGVTPTPDEADALAGLLAVLDLVPSDSGEPRHRSSGQSQPQPWGRSSAARCSAQSLVAASARSTASAPCTRCTATSCGPGTPTSRSPSPWSGSATAAPSPRGARRRSVRAADPVDDRLVPGPRRRARPPGRRCPTSRRPESLPSTAPSCSPASTTRWRGTGRSSGRWTCATSSRRSTSTAGPRRRRAPGGVDARRRRAARRPGCCTRAVLAYASDYTLLEPVLRGARPRLGRPRAEGGQPGPRDVVAPPGAGRRVAALRAGERRARRAPAGSASGGSTAGTASRRDGRPGGHAARSVLSVLKLGTGRRDRTRESRCGHGGPWCGGRRPQRRRPPQRRSGGGSSRAGSDVGISRWSPAACRA